MFLSASKSGANSAKGVQNVECAGQTGIQPWGFVSKDILLSWWNRPVLVVRRDIRSTIDRQRHRGVGSRRRAVNDIKVKTFVYWDTWQVTSQYCQ
jgi:hypothetical protein